MNRVYIIAEAEINHNGDIDIAKKMIEVAKEIGADCIKFQYVIADELADRSSPYYELFAQAELSFDEFKDLKNYAENSVGIDFMITATSPKSFSFIHKLGVKKVKIGSANINNLILLREIAKYKSELEIYLSTGMSTLSDIEIALDNLGYKKGDKNFSLFHCTSNYPAEYENLNLNSIKTLKDIYRDFEIGYSDHTTTALSAIVATSLGATLLEKHFTLDNNMEGPDHSFSTNPENLKLYIQSVRDTELALGSLEKNPAKSEIQMRKNARRFLIAKDDIKEGEELTIDKFSTKRVGEPDLAISVDKIDTVTKFKARKSYKTGEIFYWSDFNL